MGDPVVSVTDEICARTSKSPVTLRYAKWKLSAVLRMLVPPATVSKLVPSGRAVVVPDPAPAPTP